MITVKEAYRIAREQMGPFAKIVSGYENETHFVFLRKHTMGKLLTDNAAFCIDKKDGALKIVSAVPASKEFALLTEGKQLVLTDL